MAEVEEISLLDRIEGLPAEMQTEVLNYLEYNENLRLRRVCNRSRHLVEGYLSSRLPSSYLSISLDVDGPRSLAQFRSLQLSEDLIIQKVSFDYTGEENLREIWGKFLASENLDWFMETYAPHVKQLKLRSLQLPMCSARQLKFLESFTNLEEFECVLLDLTPVDLWSYFHNEETYTAPVFVPNSFKSLKKLRIDGVDCTTPPRIPTTSELNRFWDFTQRIMETTCLKEFWDPPEPNGPLDLENLAVRLKTIMDIIKSWKEQEKTPNTFVLNGFSVLVHWHEDIDINLFRPFFELCAQSNILFEEVTNNYFVSSMGDDFTKYVKTMISKNPGDLVAYDYSNLKRAAFRIDEEKNYPTGPLRCPKLRGLSLYFEELENSVNQMYHRDIADFLFHDKKHPNLTSLTIQFAEETPSLINLGDVVSACGNLTYLSLHNCASSSQDFAELFKGLRCLEHLRLSECENLDDDSFIGDNPDDPAICSLKKLKYLELIGLNHMPGVTDKTLTDAIRHIKLRCLRLTSAGDNPSQKEDFEAFDNLLSPHIRRFQKFKLFFRLNEGTFSSISPGGILSLKSGVFAETIEKFDLSEIYFQGHPNDNLQAIEKEFRSWHF